MERATQAYPGGDLPNPKEPFSTQPPMEEVVQAPLDHVDRGKDHVAELIYTDAVPEVAQRAVGLIPLHPRHATHSFADGFAYGEVMDELREGRRRRMGQGGVEQPPTTASFGGRLRKNQ
ncbi:hypothetical protein PG985_015992 [Apiospora marii]|uniref:Uncharacterized protein n=1 Tax=Apiospora marii TaxID=335849 RepID=A0ABR1S547_9PEZI